MKLATLRDGTRDGTLLVVSRDLKLALKADHIAPTLQSALDDWDYCAPQLADLAATLESTPPLRPRITRSFPTWERICSTAWST